MPVYYGGDRNDSDCESVGDHDLDTWEDWCDSDLRNRYYGFFPDTEHAQLPIIFSPQVFWGEDLGKPSQVRPDFWDASVSGLQVIPNPVVTLVPPDTNLIDVINSKKSEHKDSRIGKFSVLPLYFRDMSIGMDTLEGDVLGICSRDVGLSGCNEEEISDVLCLLRSSSSECGGLLCCE